MLYVGIWKSYQKHRVGETKENKREFTNKSRFFFFLWTYVLSEKQQAAV